MKILRTALGVLIVAALAAGVWALVFHTDWFRSKGDDDDDAGPEVMPVPTVSLGKVTKATLHRYVEGTGTVEAEPARADRPAASSKVASPVPGILAEVRCAAGDRVERGAVLFRLDDRVARSEEEKARAALGSAVASLEKLKSFPRPEQLKVAEMQVDRAKQAVEFSAKKQARTAQLVTDRLASEKTLQEVDLELATAKNDLGSAEKQLALLRSSPTREEVAEAQAKVVEAEKALEGARLQRSLYEIHSPISGTVLRARGNAGEAVDTATPLAEVADLDRLVVEGTTPSSSRELLKQGQPVEVRAGPAGASGDAPRGTVALVGSDVDRKNDSVLVRVTLPPRSPLVPGQFVRIRIMVEEHKDRLVVPRECVVRTPEGQDAVVGFLGEKAVQKPVKLGIAEGDLVEVEGEDLSEDDQIVTKGAYGLPGEAKVRVDTGAPKAPAEPPKK
jgi:multidrug efflux pump subunit AcrA (membrane-fusion protein)